MDKQLLAAQAIYKTQYDPSLEEEWRPVVGYENLYEVSNFGRVRSKEAEVRQRYGTRTRRSRMKKIITNENGYCTVNLFKDNKIKIHKCHRLLMTAFVPNPEKKRVINHKDGDKQNNHISNLEWSTHKENSIHAVQNGLAASLKGEDCHNTFLTNRDIYEIRLLHYNGIRYSTLAKVFGMHEKNISQIVNRKNWKHVN